jgi:hypothetical protein
MLCDIPWREPYSWIRRNHESGVECGPFVKIILIAAFASCRIKSAFGEALRPPSFQTRAPLIVITKCRQTNVKAAGTRLKVSVLFRKIVPMDIDAAITELIDNHRRIRKKTQVGIDVDHNRTTRVAILHVNQQRRGARPTIFTYVPTSANGSQGIVLDLAKPYNPQACEPKSIKRIGREIVHAKNIKNEVMLA